MSTIESAPTTGARKAAILLSFLGEEEAAPILRNLPTEIWSESPMRWPTSRTCLSKITMQVLEEYQQMMAAQEFIAVWRPAKLPFAFWSRHSVRTARRPWSNVSRNLMTALPSSWMRLRKQSLNNWPGFLPGSTPRQRL